jgi:4-amino-4-deoxy-L-arabinose transferase-like glycosyltransferase
MGADKASAPATRRTLTVVWRVVGALIIVVFALWLRLYDIGQPIGGFHAFNEGFYTHVSMVDASRAPFAWLTNPVDLNNPPVYSLIVTLLFRAFGVSVVLARLVSVVSGLAVAALTFELGRMLYSKWHGLAAAAVVLLMPGSVLVGRNIQTDMLALALTTASLVCYVHAMKGGNRERRFGIAAGVLFGLAMLTKLPSVLVLPGIAICETVAAKGLKWLKRPRALWAMGAAVVVAAPWYVYREVANSSFATSQSSLAGVAEWPSPEIAIRMLWTEPFWMMGAATLIAVFLGVGAMVRRWRRSDLLVTLEFATVFVFIVFYHFHAYYWTPAIPLLALMAARGVDFVSMGREGVRASVSAGLLIPLALAAAVMMSGHKWGHWSPRELVPQLTGKNSGTVLDMQQSIWDASYGPVAQVYLPKGTYIREGSPLPAGTKRVLLLRVAGPDTPFDSMLRFKWNRICVFGYAIGQWPPNFNFFENKKWQIERVGPLWKFGVVTDYARIDLALTKQLVP